MSGVSMEAAPQRVPAPQPTHLASRCCGFSSAQDFFGLVSCSFWLSAIS
jgi:hypothetical protein